MALKVGSRCWQSLSSFSPPQLLKRGGWLSVGSESQRHLAKEAETKHKTATPNAVKARNASKKEEKKEQRERFYDLIDACLNAPPPVTAWKDKTRLRVLEGETVGAIAQETLQEIVQERARAKAAKDEILIERARVQAAKTAAKSVTEEAREVPVGQAGKGPVDTVVVPAEIAAGTWVKLTAAELAKEYSRVLLAEHREWAKAEAVRLQLKKEALAALPPHLREAALVPDLTPFPKTRIPASLTPPIGGYIEDRASAAARAVTVKKSR